MNKFMAKSKKFFKKNSATILTFASGIGFVATVIMAVKATPKALNNIAEKEVENGEELSDLEVVKAAAPAYISTALVGVSTMACIFGSNALNKKQQVALASAYAFVDRSYKEFKQKAKEVYGEDAEDNIREAIAVDKCKADPPTLTAEYMFSQCDGAESMYDDEERRLFYDELSERVFESTVGAVQAAEYHINRCMILGPSCNVNDFYRFLGIPEVPWGDDLGWELCDEYCWIDFNHKKIVLDDGLEYCAILMECSPSQIEW